MSPVCDMYRLSTGVEGSIRARGLICGTRRSRVTHIRTEGSVSTPRRRLTTGLSQGGRPVACCRHGAKLQKIIADYELLISGPPPRADIGYQACTQG